MGHMVWLDNLSFYADLFDNYFDIFLLLTKWIPFIHHICVMELKIKKNEESTKRKLDIIKKYFIIVIICLNF